MLSAENWLTENPETCLCVWFSLIFQVICFQNYRVDFFHQGISVQFHLCIRLFDKHYPKYDPCICNPMGWNWQKCDCLLFLSIVKLIFSKSTGWISFINNSQDSSLLSGGDSEKYFGLRSLLQSTDKSKMPWCQCEIVICREPLKTKLKTLSSFFDFCKIWSKVLQLGKKAYQCSPAVLFDFYLPSLQKNCSTSVDLSNRFDNQ